MVDSLWGGLRSTLDDNKMSKKYKLTSNIAGSEERNEKTIILHIIVYI